jgi:heavy metal translocating P-type ATPase
MKKISLFKSTGVKIWVNVFLCVLLLISLFVSFFHGVSKQTEEYLLLGTSILGIIPVMAVAIRAIISRRITIDLLASIALLLTIYEGELMSAVFINLMLASARIFDAYTERKTENIITHLLKLRPSHIKVKRGGAETEIKFEDVLIGDIVVVESGDRIPVDGVVIGGQASVDQSTLTGESAPIVKKDGDEVFSSTLNVSGSLLVRTEKIGEDTTLAKIIALVDEASRSKTNIEKIADRFATWYIVIVGLATAIIYFISGDMSLVLSILLVTCADDIALAVPLGFTVAISKAAKHGIIIKGAAVVERIKDIKVIITDKTGTLTKGQPKIQKIILLSGGTDFTEGTFKEILALCSVNSNHPVSKAIMKQLNKDSVNVVLADSFIETPGDGVLAQYKNNRYLAGKVSYLKENQVQFTNADDTAIKEIQDAGLSVTAVAENNHVIGCVAYEDEIKRFAKESIIETKEMGVNRWIMLTGDNEQVAKRVADQVGIDEYHFALKPADKLAKVKEIKKKHGEIAMMGDGVNDAAALAIADVSFAMGAIGSDASIEASDVALMHDDLRRVPEAMLLSRKAMRIIRQNFLIWILTNAIGLYLVFTGKIGPMGASAWNFATDFIPIINIFQIYFLKINKHTYDTEAEGARII